MWRTPAQSNAALFAQCLSLGAWKDLVGPTEASSPTYQARGAQEGKVRVEKFFQENSLWPNASFLRVWPGHLVGDQLLPGVWGGGEGGILGRDRQPQQGAEDRGPKPSLHQEQGQFQAPALPLALRAPPHQGWTLLPLPGALSTPQVSRNEGSREGPATAQDRATRGAFQDSAWASKPCKASPLPLSSMGGGAAEAWLKAAPLCPVRLQVICPFQENPGSCQSHSV